jgi:hypothetical protein
VLRTMSPERTLWEAILPEACQQMPAQLEAVLRAPEVFVHPFRSNPYSDSGVFVQLGRRVRSAAVR